MVHGDERGEFVEWFKGSALAEATGYSFNLAQANLSRSAKGTVRGIHFADVPPGQAKYVTCVRGAIIDYIVDIRVGSPTFGQWDSVEVTASSRNAVFLEEGLGHAFCSLEDDTTVAYLVSDIYRPDKEHGINPLDVSLGISFPFPPTELSLSSKDTQAPSLAEAEAAGLLPLWSNKEDR
jgi:dTDP-4-dehydrorhamnose 3,5-epimerase